MTGFEPISWRIYQNTKKFRPWVIFQDTCRIEHSEKNSQATVPFTHIWTQELAAWCALGSWDQLSLRVYCTLHIQPYSISTRLSSKIRKLRKLAPRHKILTGGTTEAEGRRELAQHGVLPSLARYTHQIYHYCINVSLNGPRLVIPSIYVWNYTFIQGPYVTVYMHDACL
jgi:hypothetical protein